MSKITLMNKIAVLLITSLYVCLACKSDDIGKIVRSEKTTIFSVEGTTQYQVDTIQYAEIEHFAANDVLVEHHFLFPNGDLKAKQVYEFLDHKTNASGSKYYDYDGTLLSYYRYDYENGKMSAFLAYDASNNELLRIEHFKYNDKGLRTVKEIRDANNTLSRAFSFTYDDEDNMSSLTVSDNKGKILFREDYKVIGKNKITGKWTELWGFIGKIPNSCKVREFIDA